MNLFAMVSTRRSAAFTGHALATFYRSGALGPGDRFLLIDNDGSTTSADLGSYRDLTVVDNPRPASFAANANRAMDAARGDTATLFLLNNDLIFPSGWLSPLAAGSDAVLSPLSNREVPYEDGALRCAPCMDLEDYLGHEEALERIARRHSGSRRGYREVLAFPFFCTKIPFAVYDRVGPFDEAFGPGGGEDYDYAIRCHQAGFALRYAEASYVLHFQGKSTWRGGESDHERQARRAGYMQAFQDKWGPHLLRLIVYRDQAVLDAAPGLRQLATDGRWAQVIQRLTALDSLRPDARKPPREATAPPRGRRVPHPTKGHRMESHPPDEEPAPEPEPGRPKLEFHSSRQFPAWMVEQGISLAVSSYQTGKLILLGVGAEGRLSVFERTFDRAMGLYGDGQSLYLSTLFLLWRFENVLAPGQNADGHDRLYIPQMAYTTGDIDIHDLNMDADGRLVFVNTLFGCLATVSHTHSFEPLWKPPFISRLAAEDRCHLNGVAMKEGRPAYVTCVSQTDVADGWRDRRQDGGTVLAVPSGEAVAAGLSMPHSPRWHRHQLWLVEAGSGHVGTVDLKKGMFERKVFCPGYLRGLAFVGDFAIVGSSKLRENRTFKGLPLDDNLRQRDADARCGLFVIDLRTGDLVHWLRIEGIVEELYDVIALPGVRRPSAIGLKTDEIRRTLSIGPERPL